MTETVLFDAVVTNNKLILTPRTAIQDNFVYEISLRDIVSLDGISTLDSTDLTIVTELTPAYTSYEAVLSLVQEVSIPVSDILYHIREASKYVNYIKNGMPIATPIPYEVEQCARYKAAHDCLLSFYMKLAADGGGKGQLGEVIFDNGTSRLKDISTLLKDLKDEITVWEKAVRGYKLEGNAKPLVALRSRLVQSPYAEYTPINTSMNRGV